MMVLFLLLAGVSAWALLLLLYIVRARNKRLLLAAAPGTSCDAPDGIGVSVVCSGVNDLAQVENLLSVEYTRYEVIVVLDAQKHPAGFEELAARYRMIRVEYLPTWEFPVHGVRALGRSRKRSFRRLVMIDRLYDTPEGDFDAGACVAAYDHILPLREGQYLLPGAVERMVAEADEQSGQRPCVLRTWIGEPVALYAREALIAVGGFTCRPLRTIPRPCRRTLWEPVCTGPASVGGRWRRIKPAVSLLLAAAVVFAAAAGHWPLVSLLLTAALVWAAAEYARQSVARIEGARGVALVAWKRYMPKIRRADFF